MEATPSSEISRNYKYPYFDPTSHDWNIDTNNIKHFEFVNYINKSHNQNDTLYLIFDFIPKLQNTNILPFTITKESALLNDNSKFTLENLMPQYIAGASHLKDVSVSILEVNKLVHQYGKERFRKLDIFYQQLNKIDKFKQEQTRINNNNNNNNNKEKNKNNNSNKKDEIKNYNNNNAKNTKDIKMSVLKPPKIENKDIEMNTKNLNSNNNNNNNDDDGNDSIKSS